MERNYLIVLLTLSLLFSGIYSYAARVEDERNIISKPYTKNKPAQTKYKGEDSEGTDKEEYISMDFDNVDIKTIIKFMSELTNTNFIIDDKIKGKVTILSPKKIPLSEALNVFKSILEMHGFATVPSGNIVKVVSAVEGRTKAIETNIDKGIDDIDINDRMITQLIPLEHADSNEVKNIFIPLMSKHSNIINYAPTNTLIITDIASNIKRISRIIKEIDIEEEASKIEVIPIIYANATELSSRITSIIETSSKPRKSSAALRGRQRRSKSRSKHVSRLIGKIKIVPDDRTNTIIVSAVPEDILRIIKIIKKLDIKVPSPTPKIHVYYLEFASAEEIVTVLQGQTQQISKINKNNTAKDKFLKNKQVRGLQRNEDTITITADKATNSLVIVAGEEDYKTLVNIIEKLDIMRPQVLVEALIAEVSFKKTLELGTELRLFDDPNNLRVGGATSFGNLIGTTAGALQGGLPSGSFMGVINGKLGELPNILALTKAFQSDNSINILSTPHILTTDNQEAEIIIGEERPFLSRSQSDSTGASVFKTFDFKDVGITLRITPHISKEKFVRLELFQEIKGFIAEAEGEVGAVTTSKKQAKTTVTIEDGQTIVIGGLISKEKEKSISRVPCLGSIPVLGWLFKSFSVPRDDKTNLLIFLTPYVIKTPEELTDLTKKKKKEMDESVEEELNKKDIIENIKTINE